MADWWYTKNGERQGPVSSSQLRQLAQSGELLPTDMVFKEGGSEWKLASTVSNLFPPAASGGSSGFRTDRPAREERNRGGGDFDDADYNDRPSKRMAGGESSGGLKDLLAFRRMIAPTIIIIVFWVGIIGACLAGLGMIIAGTVTGGVMGLLGGLFGALIGIPITALMIRLYAELAILLFRMNETLTDIKQLLEKDQRSK